MSRLRVKRPGDGGLDALLDGFDPARDGGGRRRWSRPGFVIGAVIIAAVLVLLARLFLFGSDPATPAPGGGTGGGPVAADGACPDQATADKLPASGADNAWVPVGAVQAPTAPHIGPARTVAAGQPPACFAPGPAGALFAAANFLADLTDPTLVAPAIRTLTAPSAGRDALIHILDTTPAALNVTGSTGYTFVGYTFQNQAASQATVSLAIYTARGALGQVNITLARDGNDWHVVPPPSGNFADIVHQITSLNCDPRSPATSTGCDFTRWTPIGG